MAGPALLGATAISYARIAGANERIHLGHVGAGNRGRELAAVVAGLRSSHNVEMIAVCDLWSVNRERAAKAAADESRYVKLMQEHAKIRVELSRIGS